MSIKEIEEIVSNSRYKNIDYLPRGWIKTTATIAQLRKIKVVNYKLMSGYNKSGRYFSPILHNIIRKQDVKRVEEYLNNKHKSKTKSISAIERYARWYTDNDTEAMEDIIEAYNNNKETKGTAWKLLAQAYKNKDKYDFEAILNMMNVAHYRHTKTNYDDINKKGMSDESVSDLRRLYI